MKIGRKILASAFIYLFGIASAFSAEIASFDVSLTPGSIKVGESLDLMIEAVDMNGSVVQDYEGEIMIFSDSDPEVELPIQLVDYTYKFKASDLGKVVFENGVRFSHSGTQNIYVYDYDNDDVSGIGEVIVTDKTAAPSINIEIISPENGLIIGENSVKVSGITDRNHNIKIIVNGVDKVNAVSNDSGVFEEDIVGLADGQNVIIAKVLDADDIERGTSNSVIIKVDNGSITLSSVRAIPDEVEVENAYEIEVIATPNLAEVQGLINSVVVKLQEIESGKYTVKSYAPAEVGTYAIDITLRDELGHEKKELGAGSLKVFGVTSPPNEPPSPPVNCNPLLKEKDLEVSGLKLVELKSKSVLTWNKIESAASYNIYKKLENGNLEFIDNVLEPRFEVLVDISKDKIEYEYFAVKAIGKDCDGKDFEGPLSEATKIQTGPEMIILLILAMLIGGIVLWISNRKRA